MACVGMLNPHVPGITGHLIACSVTRAPASMVIAKLMLPEIETPETPGNTRIEIPRVSVNAVDALAVGTADGPKLALNIGAMLIAFLAIVAMVNWGLKWIGAHVFHASLSLQPIFGRVFAPLAWIMGVPAQDVTRVGSLPGQKLTLNEFVAYTHMSQRIAQDSAWLTERGRLIASSTPCGFANFGSVGITIGGYNGLAPECRSDLSHIALRAHRRHAHHPHGGLHRGNVAPTRSFGGRGDCGRAGVAFNGRRLRGAGARGGLRGYWDRGGRPVDRGRARR